MLNRRHKLHVFIINDEDTILAEKVFDINLFRYNKKPLKIKNLLYQARKEQTKINTKRLLVKSIIEKNEKDNNNN